VTEENGSANRHGGLGSEELDKGGDLLLEEADNAPDADIDLVTDTVAALGTRVGRAELHGVGNRCEGEDKTRESGRRDECVLAGSVQRRDQRENEYQLGQESESRRP